MLFGDFKKNSVLVSSAPPSTAQPTTASFVSKPISDINNMFQKFTPQAFASETKSQSSIVAGTSDETGEPENTVIKTNETPKEEKPMKNLFEMKSSSSISSDTKNVPDVLKMSPPSLNKIDKPVPRPVENVLESKENIRETSEIVAQKGDTDKQENIVKPFAKAAVKPSVFASAIPPVSSPSSVIGNQKHRYYFILIYGFRYLFFKT